MPNTSPVIRVILEVKRGYRRWVQLTTTQVRALETVSEAGKVSDAIPFASARSLANRGFLEQKGPYWFITPLGKELRRKVRTRSHTLKP